MEERPASVRQRITDVQLKDPDGCRSEGGWRRPAGLGAWSQRRKVGRAQVGGDWARLSPWGGQKGALKPKPWGGQKEESEPHDSGI